MAPVYVWALFHHMAPHGAPHPVVMSSKIAAAVSRYSVWLVMSYTFNQASAHLSHTLEEEPN